MTFLSPIVMKWIGLLGSAFCIYICIKQLRSAIKDKVISGDVRSAKSPLLFWFLVFTNLIALPVMLLAFVLLFGMTVLKLFHA